MGLVENGAVSGVIPQKTVFAVNYPGYPISITRAVETLGGEDAISKARSSESNYLELRFRPEEPFAHPIFGELHGMSGLLLQLSRVQEKEKSHEELTAEIVAKVNESYNFFGMSDYQYVRPVHAKLARKRKYRHLGNFQNEQGGLLDMEQEEIMVLPPPLFSVKDMPEDLVLRPSEVSRAYQRHTPLAEQPWEMDIATCFNVDFKIKDIPPKINWEEKLHKDSEEWHIQSTISKLFDDRPIWAKATINDELIGHGICLTDLQLRRFLFRTSYYFSQGPFRTLWIRKGYDPRKDPESRIYQMIDFRMPKLVKEAARVHVDKRTQDMEGITWSDICSFNEAPLKKFSYLQLYDLKDDYIQNQIRRPPERPICDEFTGWFERSTIVRIRSHIRMRYLSLIPGDNARHLEQSEFKKLGILKRLDQIASCQPQITESTSAFAEDMSNKENEVGHPAAEVAETSLHKGDLNVVNSDDDNEYEEEYDDEEDEDQQAQDINVDKKSQNADIYMGPFDSIPRNYLQELLKKFPMSSNDNVRTMAQVDLSDEDAEYDIYEQDDDEEDDI